MGSTHVFVLSVALVMSACSGPPSDVQLGGSPDRDGGPELPELTRELLAEGLDRPIYGAAPPGDPRLFIAEQHQGTIRIYRDGALLPQPFLEIGDLIGTRVEQGLLGFAFHPNYESNGRFFVSYTDRAEDSVLAEFQVMGSDPDAIDPASNQTLLIVEQDYQYHNMNTIVFGPDGYLYVAVGDGGGNSDPDDRSQDPTDLHGKILRIDVDAPGDTTPYSIPEDNPFDNEVWVMGLRNPWAFSFDPIAGDLYIPDVGFESFEELNILNSGDPGGANFGWDIVEGSLGECFNDTTCDATGVTMPVYEYSHEFGCSIIGGQVYAGAEISALDGTYFFADFCDGDMYSLEWNGVSVENVRAWESLDTDERIPHIFTSGDGELYLLHFDHETAFSGTLSKIVEAP